VATPRARRNRTITLTQKEKAIYAKDLITIDRPAGIGDIENKIANHDLLQILDLLPGRFADLLILDPPYNLNKSFAKTRFKKKSLSDYTRWFEGWFVKLLPTLTPDASVYVCSDWHSSTAVHIVLEKYLRVRSRITWEREKGRGARKNWKNCSEDIWFATVSNDYTFNVDAVKLKRRVIAPYTRGDGSPKGWDETAQGRFRLTHPSNFWSDITVPFWSMPENTDHPTQKPEKLLAKLILASTNPGELVFDPFAGTGSALAAAKKLGRRFFGVEIEKQFCLLAAKRLHLAETDKSIQGFKDGTFWERNTPAIGRR